MKAVVCVNQDWGIGANNELLCHIPEDLQKFKSLTFARAVVYGRKTLLSLPGQKPLSGRTNVVISSHKDNIPEISKKSCDYYCYIQEKKFRGEDVGIAGIQFNKTDFSECEVKTSLILLDETGLVQKIVPLFVHSSNDIFICGGYSIYFQLLKYCDTVYVTKAEVKDKVPDRYFLNLDKSDQWKLTYKEGTKKSVTGIKYNFNIYTRVSEIGEIEVW